MVELSSLGVKKSPQQVNFIVAAVDNLQQLLQRVFLVVVVLAALVVVFWLVTGSYLAYRTSERDKLITQMNQMMTSCDCVRRRWIPEKESPPFPRSGDRGSAADWDGPGLRKRQIGRAHV